MGGMPDSNPAALEARESWARPAHARVTAATGRIDSTSPPTAVSETISLTWEVVLLLALAAVAAFVRLHHLSTFPNGLHGDEAVAGLEGRRILNQGWIGVYSP